MQVANASHQTSSRAAVINDIVGRGQALRAPNLRRHDPTHGIFIHPGARSGAFDLLRRLAIDNQDAIDEGASIDP